MKFFLVRLQINKISQYCVANLTFSYVTFMNVVLQFTVFCKSNSTQVTFTLMYLLDVIILKFAAKQPWVYLNLEFFDKYIDVIFSNWVQLSFLILFQMRFLFVIRIPLEANHDCWDCLLRLCVASLHRNGTFHRRGELNLYSLDSRLATAQRQTPPTPWP